MRTRVKICGITNSDDAMAAVDAGADALGIISAYPASPRNVGFERMTEIVAALPPYVTPVALFVDPSVEAVNRALQAQAQMLQFHGQETPEFCAQFGAAYMKAVRVSAGIDLIQWALRYAGSRGLLLDADVAGLAGGTGQTFDWNLIPRTFPLPMVLSGGLNPGNVGQAIRYCRPAAVDVSSGVERDGAKGVKDHRKLRAFMREVRDVDAELYAV